MILQNVKLRESLCLLHSYFHDIYLGFDQYIYCEVQKDSQD